MNLYLRLLLLSARSRWRPRLSPWDTARTPFRVLPTDLDLLGHVNNGRYLTLMDVARIDHMRRCGLWAAFAERGWYPVVAGQTITYRRSLRLWQRFWIDTRILGADERWVYLEQAFVTRGGQVAARAHVRARFLKRTGGSVGVDELAEAAGGFPDDLRVPDWLPAWSETTGRVDAQGAAPGRPGD